MGEIVYRLFAPNLITVCISDVVDGDFVGELWQQYEAYPSSFHGITDMIFQMEELYDKWNFPQRSTNCRSFRTETDSGASGVHVKRGKRMSVHNVQEKRGKKGTFIVQVQYRQNSTWQGQVVWAEENRKEHFRSALELMKLIDSAMSENEAEMTEEAAV